MLVFYFVFFFSFFSIRSFWKSFLSLIQNPLFTFIYSFRRFWEVFSSRDFFYRCFSTLSLCLSLRLSLFLNIKYKSAIAMNLSRAMFIITTILVFFCPLFNSSAIYIKWNACKRQKRIEIVERFLPATVLQSFSPLKSSTFLDNYFGVMNIKTRPIAILFMNAVNVKRKVKWLMTQAQFSFVSFHLDIHTHKHPARRTTHTHIEIT